MSRSRALLALVLAGALSAGAAPSPSGARHDLAAARAAQAEAARRYRASLEPLLALREAAAGRAEADVARRRALAAQGLTAPADAAVAERALDEARAALERTRASIREAASVEAEAEAAATVAALPPTAPGEVRADGRLLRHDGRAPWSLAQLPTLEAFFAGRFGHALPVSARGQTPVHARLGLDHHDALDVAVHPDSPEGRALIAYLRDHGIPFLAFRTAVTGAATGAHVHVGAPSGRL